LELDEDARLKMVRETYRRRFNEEPPRRRSVEQLHGIEGVRVRAMYQALAKQYGITWHARNYDHSDWSKADLPNRCLSAATACLYCVVTEAAVLAAGYAPAIGIIHTGKPLSFVYDVADIYKFETVVPVAFAVAAKGGSVRRARRAFRLPGCVSTHEVARTDYSRYRNHADSEWPGNPGGRGCRRRCHSKSGEAG
jgi:CRISPR-associated protein Cas1